MKKNEQHTDELILKVKTGDNTAFEALVFEYDNLIRTCVSSFLGEFSRSDREEMMQEARVALYKAARSYRILNDGVTFGLYAKICIRHALQSYLRSRKEPVRSLDEMNEKGRVHDPAESDISLDLIRAEAVSQLYESMKRELSPFEFEVCMSKANGMTNSQIASSLKKTSKAVSNAFSRAQNKLRSAADFNN